LINEAGIGINTYFIRTVVAQSVTGWIFFQLRLKKSKLRSRVKITSDINEKTNKKVPGLSQKVSKELFLYPFPFLEYWRVKKFS